MKVEILKDVKGVNEGQIYPTDYKKGEIVIIGKSLTKAFLGMGVAKVHEEPEPEPEPEPEIKVIENKQETKVLPDTSIKKTKKKGGRR